MLLRFIWTTFRNMRLRHTPLGLERFFAGFLLVAAAGSGPIAAQPLCSADSRMISALPYNDRNNTCGFSNTVSRYTAPVCRKPGTNYGGRDVVYKVFLNQGKGDIAFDLTVTRPTDLVLALLGACRDGGSCVIASEDGRGNERVVLPAASPTGVYYLYIDSATDTLGNDRCGEYILSVTGTNPTLRLKVELSSPSPAVAGSELIYTMRVTNDSGFTATGVKATLTIPREAAWVRGCTRATATEVVCSMGDLASRGSASSTVRVKVADPALRGSLNSTAHAEANEGPPTPKTLNRTTVIGETDLSIKSLAVSRQTAVAGQRLTYTFEVHNAGPSEANTVEVADVLPDNVTPVSASCVGKSRRLLCTIPKLGVGKSVLASVVALVSSSAAEGSSLAYAANAITSKEREPNPDRGSNSVVLQIPVTRRADLAVATSAPIEVTAGDPQGLRYEVGVCNCGPSDSAGATITYDLSELHPGVRLLSSQSGCTESAGRIVTCSTGRIAVGGCRADKSCDLNLSNNRSSFVIDVPSSLSPEPTLSLIPTIQAAELDTNAENTKDVPATQVRVKADLGITKTDRTIQNFAETESTAAGANLAYQLEVKNAGPSDSPGGMVRDVLPPGLRFVSSPDGCEESQQGTTFVVSCPVPRLPVNQSHPVRFVVAVPVDAPATLVNQAAVEGEADEIDANDVSAQVSTVVKQKADLAVTVSASPDPLNLSQGRDLVYTIVVANAGPSNAANVVVSLTLPEGGSFVSSVPPCDPAVDGGPVLCRINLIEPGESSLFEVQILAPSQRGTAKAMISVNGTEDPNTANNSAEETTTLALATDADLAVSKTAGLEAAVAGDLLPYTIEVVNRGPSAATDVDVTDELPPGVTLVSVAEPRCESRVNDTAISCSFPTLETGSGKRIPLTVKVNDDFAGLPSLITNTAKNPPEPAADPNPDNNRATAKTPVLRVSPLVLPYFKAGAEGVTSLLAVRNPSETKVGLRLDYFLAGQSRAASCETPCLEMKQTLTRSLRDQFPDAGLQEGHVNITPIPAGECREVCDPDQPSLPLESPPTPPLSGDFIRVEPSAGHAGGQLLVSTDTSRSPAELCRHWSTRFLNGGGFKGNTELFFFVPGNAGISGPVVKGRVYEEKTGRFVQEISITATQTAFRRTTQEGFDSGVPLLASFGTIEWEFAEGVVGNISAIHRAEGGFAVPVPGFCRRPPAAENLGAEPALLVPYFEVDSSAVNTLFAVHNESDGEVAVRYEYCPASGSPVCAEETLPLPAKAVRTVSLRGLPAAQGLARGYVRVSLAGSPQRRAPILSGDFVRIDTGQHLASGGALVDTDLHRSPPQLCRRWNVRFLQAAPLKTAFVFHLRPDGSGDPVSVKGTAYDENGAILKTIEIPEPLRIAFQMDGSDPLLSLDGNGFIDWTLQGLEGNLASILRGEGISVLLPGVCVF